MDKINAIFEKVEQDWHISSYDVAGELGIDHKTVLAHLKKAGYTKKLDIWVPHELTERNLMNRVLICDSLLRRNETEPFLKKLITGDEKWITYDKNVRKRSWSKASQASQSVAKPGLTRNKVMLCVWWDWKGIIHYELLPCRFEFGTRRCYQNPIYRKTLHSDNLFRRRYRIRCE
ncbi:hypothetical protein K1T71_008313 [Dendrolimus kikuchii]|uniref:Uncharacterized protein n=1 Tax=Dendrolimus kikuchii TaxID=765133 RepID=A0ACC1CXB2_9NEOP|nr:hypothetical protein K1T71_008313 [Dendrolimus kikuchii]